MKKITFLLLLLTSATAFSQTVLFNYDDVLPDFEFCFDAPDPTPNECTATPVTNNDTTGENPSSVYLQSQAPTVGAAFDYGVGVEFTPIPAPTIDNDGSFLTVAFRSDNNPTGTLNVTAQLWASDGNAIDGFSTYTMTDGSWQVLEFDYTNQTPAGTFTTSTDIIRVNFFVEDGTATGYLYGFDEVTLNTSTTLSTNEFEKSNALVWPNPANDVINIRGEFSGKNIQIVDILGKVILESAIKGNENAIDVSSLSNGAYFLKLDNGNTFKFLKN